MRCNIDERVRDTFGSFTAVLAFNEMIRALMDATNKIPIGKESEKRMKAALIQGKEILERIINPIPGNFDLADLFDHGTKDIRWLYEVRQHRTESFLSPEDMKNLWHWMKKEEVQKMMENRRGFLENLIKTMERLTQKREEIRSGEVLFLIELFSIFWELLTYNEKTTTREGYVSVLV